MTAPWQGLNYSVGWDGYGSVSKANGLSQLWECAVKACKKGQRIGVAFGTEVMIVDASWTHFVAADQAIEYLIDATKMYGGITAIAFEYREEAEDFVDRLDKIIMWKLLQRDFSE